MRPVKQRPPPCLALPAADGPITPTWIASRDIASVGKSKPVATPATATTGDGLLTIKDVAAHFGISVRTVSRAIRSGELKSVKFRRSVRIPATAVEELTSGKNAMKTVNRIVS